MFLFSFIKCISLAEYVKDKWNKIFLSRILVGYLFFWFLSTCITSISEITHAVNKQFSWSVIFPGLILLFWVSLTLFLIFISLFIKDDQHILVKIGLIIFKQKGSSQSDKNKENNNEIEMVEMHKDNENQIKKETDSQINQVVINANIQEATQENIQEVSQDVFQEESYNERIDIEEVHDGGEESDSLEVSQADVLENHKEHNSEDNRDGMYKLTLGNGDGEISQKSNEDQSDNENIEEFKDDAYDEHNMDNLTNNNEYSNDINEESIYMDNEENYPNSNEESVGQNNEASDEINNEDIDVEINDGNNHEIDENKQNNGQIANQNKKEIENLREDDNANKGHAWLYTAAFLTHRILIVLCLIVAPSNPIIRIIAFIVMQVIYIVWLVISRPFINKFDNIHKISNEIYIIIYLCIMLALHFFDEEVTIIL